MLTSLVSYNSLVLVVDGRWSVSLDLRDGNNSYGKARWASSNHRMDVRWLFMMGYIWIYQLSLNTWLPDHWSSASPGGSQITNQHACNTVENRVVRRLRWFWLEVSLNPSTPHQSQWRCWVFELSLGCVSCTWLWIKCTITQWTIINT